MLIIRKSNERGKSNIGWLNSSHTFSFSDYYDERFMGFSCLRVINEDIVQPKKGFGQHPHKNMEIISYIIEGELEHRDSLGTGSIIIPGEIQRMSAGSGITHSEFNPSSVNPLHFLQIWITPAINGTPSSYEQKVINKVENKLILIGSQNNNSEGITINQDVKLFAAYLSPEAVINYKFDVARVGWLQLIKGSIKINDMDLSAGDGVGIKSIDDIEIICKNDAELLFFDLKE